MTSPVRRRSTRDRPAKAPLSEDAIVEVALAVLKSDGPEAVTMRRVAAALDTGPASLYVYVSGREGLLQHFNHSVYIHWKYAKAWHAVRDKKTRRP